MKNFFLICLLLISTSSFAQKDHFLSYRDGFKTYGYVNGQRLDSLDAQYLTFSWTISDKLKVDFGQYRDGKEELLVNDAQNLPYKFETSTITFVLNFLYFNGWEVDHIMPSARFNSGFSDGFDSFLLRKRKDK